MTPLLPLKQGPIVIDSLFHNYPQTLWHRQVQQVLRLLFSPPAKHDCASTDNPNLQHLSASA